MEHGARVNRNALGDMEPQKAVWWLPLTLPSPLVLFLLLPQNFNKQIDFKIICRPFWQLMKVYCQLEMAFLCIELIDYSLKTNITNTERE